MSDYLFCGMHYGSEREMCDAIAEHWLSADGCNSHKTMRGILFAETDAHLADGCLSRWFSDPPPDGDDEPAPNRDALVRAFGRLRQDFDRRVAAGDL